MKRKRLTDYSIRSITCQTDKNRLHGNKNEHNYRGYRAAGSSLYPKELFALAGVDLTNPAPVENTFGVLAGMVARLAG